MLAHKCSCSRWHRWRHFNQRGFLLGYRSIRACEGGGGGVQVSSSKQASKIGPLWSNCVLKDVNRSTTWQLASSFFIKTTYFPPTRSVSLNLTVHNETFYPHTLMMVASWVNLGKLWLLDRSLSRKPKALFSLSVKETHKCWILKKIIIKWGSIPFL